MLSEAGFPFHSTDLDTQYNPAHAGRQEATRIYTRLPHKQSDVSVSRQPALQQTRERFRIVHNTVWQQWASTCYSHREVYKTSVLATVPFALSLSLLYPSQLKGLKIRQTVCTPIDEASDRVSCGDFSFFLHNCKERQVEVLSCRERKQIPQEEESEHQ